jgi:hypothetical protein
LVRAAEETWRVRKVTGREYIPSLAVERSYKVRMREDRKRLYGEG